MLLGLAVAGCSSDDTATLAEGEGGGAEELTDSYVTLNFTMAFAGQGTRANNPTGGENGDGTEAGQETDETNENEITSAVAFLYQDADGVNGNASTEVTPVYFGTVHEDVTSQTPTYTTEPQRITLPNGDYHILVVANPGTDWWTNPTEKLNLGNVRNHLQLQKQAWTETDGKFSNFLMSSANDGGKFTLASQPESAPLNINVDVERMAARIDYQAEGPIEGAFGCTDNSGKVEILGAAIVNDYTAGSYLIKRVADDVIGSNPVYLGDEVEGQNYVLDPKTNSTKLEGDYKSGTYYPVIIDTEGKWADPNVWDAFVQEGTPLTVGGETWNRIGYTMENTTPTTATKEATNTGVVFKAQFTPAPGTVKGDYDYDNHATFFSYRGVLYASMEDVMKAFYGEDKAVYEGADTLKLRFSDEEAFTLSGDTASVKLNCEPNSARINVAFAESMDTYFSDYQVVISTAAQGGSVYLWKKDTKGPVYFKVNNQEKVGIKVELTPKTGSKAEPYETTYTLSPKDAKKITVAASSSSGSLGITIKIDETVVEHVVNINIPSDWVE